MKIAAYCRVSTDSSDQLNSLENQQSYFTRVIHEKGHSLFFIYADKGLTGTKLNNRPMFEKLLYDAGIDTKVVVTNRGDRRSKSRHTIFELSDREPLFHEIWVKNTSRFARNTLSYDIIGKLRQKKVNILFIEQNINTNDIGQDLLLKLMQIFDEQDSKDKSLKVTTGIIEGAKKGTVRTNGRLYGYNYDQKTNSLIAIESEAMIIKLIFDLYANGSGTRKIYNYLMIHGIKTRNGKDFGKTTIRNILKNEKYAGLNNPLKYDSGVVFQKNGYAKVRESYDITQCDRIEPIITQELFDKCKNILDNSFNHQTSKGIYKGATKYSGLIICGNCGSVYYSNVDDGRRYYQCSKKRMQGMDYCNNPNISLQRIEKYIAHLKNESFQESFELQKQIILKTIATKIELLLGKIDSDNTAIGMAIKNLILQENTALGNYYELYASSTASKEILGKKIEACEQRIIRLEEQYEEATKSNEDVKKEIEELLGVFADTSDSRDLPKIITEDDVLDNLKQIVVGGAKDSNGDILLSNVMDFKLPENLGSCPIDEETDLAEVILRARKLLEQ